VELADRLPIEGGQHICDIGRAGGGPARIMAERFACRVPGIDITTGFIEKAGAKPRCRLSPADY
jgi:cyclopropane fatty-acyl-phospholipid synthase-like methyltransferase